MMKKKKKPKRKVLQIKYCIRLECSGWGIISAVNAKPYLSVRLPWSRTLKRLSCCRSVVHGRIIVQCGLSISLSRAIVSRVVNIVNRMATHIIVIVYAFRVINPPIYDPPPPLKNKTTTNQYYLSPFLRVYYITYSIIYIYIYMHTSI